MPIPSCEPARIHPPHPSSRGGHALWARSVLRLQQTVGNREVLRLIGQSQPAETAAQAMPVVACVPEPEPVPAPWRLRVLAAMRRLRPGSAAQPQGDTVVLLEDKR